MSTLRQVHGAARAIARSQLGRDPGAMELADSSSHYVYVSRLAVVKIIDAADHTRMDREITVVAGLPAEIAPELLGSGRSSVGSREIRYACFRTAPGTSPGMGLLTADEDTALMLTEQAVERLRRLHLWTPHGDSDRVLRQPLDHGGFTGRASLQAAVEELARQNVDLQVPQEVLNRLRVIADHASLRTEAFVPVHADCHWGNWLTNGPTVTALLDFEWARFGTPVDDWFFLARFSGRHQAVVLDRIARMTATLPDDLRAACEVREAAYLVSDLLTELAARPSGETVAEIMHDLEQLTVDRSWWDAPH